MPMKMQLSLSAKSKADGRKQIMLRYSPTKEGKRFNFRAGSECYVYEKYFDAKGDGIKSDVRIRPKEYEEDKDTVKNKLHELINHIESEFENADLNGIANNWMSDIVAAYLHPKTDTAEEQQPKPFYDLAAEYLAEKKFSVSRERCFRVLERCISRYEGFVRATQKERKDFVFDVSIITSEDIKDLMDYIRSEKELSDEYPKLFESLCSEYPASLKPSRTLASRGGNTVVDSMRRLRAFFTWCNEVKGIGNRPFEGVKIGSEYYGTPYYITIAERNKLAETPMPTKHLEVQRDIFVFQCLIGCRVGDLMSLTESNIQKGILSYTPHKTKDKKHALQVRVPLIDEAVALIKKYRGIDVKGRLFPFISAQKYNDAIKEVLTVAEITRKVEVRNTLTGEFEFRAINEIASSHMARRTFCGNLYFKVKDPNLIGKMSGHVEGSKAFCRYRNMEDETLTDAVNLLK